MKRMIGLFVGAAIAMAASAGNAMVVFSDNFDDGDVTDWVKSTNYAGTTSVQTDGTAVSGQSLFTYLTAPPGGTNLIVRATKSFNAPVAGDYLLSLYAVSTVCSGCTVSYDVLVDGMHLDRKNFTSGFEARNFNLMGLSAGTHSLILGVYTTNASSGLFGARFDNVEVSTQAEIPEASTLAALAGGLTALGAGLVRRRHQ